MKPGGLALVVTAAALAACATSAVSSAPRAVTVASIPSPECVALGTVDARETSELLSPPDVLAAAAIERVRLRAARRGATHVVVAPQPTTGMVSYTTTATAAGLALRCVPPAWTLE
jgi:hypothetical protein